MDSDAKALLSLRECHRAETLRKKCAVPKIDIKTINEQIPKNAQNYLIPEIYPFSTTIYCASLFQIDWQLRIATDAFLSLLPVTSLCHKKSPNHALSHLPAASKFDRHMVGAIVGYSVICFAEPFCSR